MMERFRRIQEQITPQGRQYFKDVADRVQTAYNAHRAPELWGTPEVSPGFFDRLRNEGLNSAWNYLVEREKSLGDPKARPEIKAAANLIGSTFLVLGIRELSGLSDEELEEATYNPSLRTRIGKTIFNITLGLLFFAQNENSRQRRVAVDYDDTLIDTEQSMKQDRVVLRPGAKLLLDKLNREGYDTILYSNAGGEWVNKLFEEHPEFRNYFSDIVTADNAPKHDLSNVTDRNEYDFLDQLNKGYAGGKDPRLVGADALLDDFINPEAEKRLGFKGIKVPHPKVDKSDKWVDDVIKKLKKS